ncbi:MAG TPA: glycosyltransferase family 4 protein [Phycisphaerae bacterium]|nr:glycosyltransferase family 4 protein [Phycisphaerae bacterium]
MNPSLCHIFEAIGPYSGIGRVAMSGVQIALDAGYRVTVIAKRLDESLQPHVQWLPLTVPPRGFAFQWLSARHYIKKALGTRTFDIIHAHQPQVAHLSHIFQCHFLTRVAYERKCLETRRTLRARINRAQQQIVLHAEDRCYRHWNPDTRLLFCSELLRQEFARLYGLPPKQNLLSYAFPKIAFASPEQRRESRRKLLGRDHDGLVLGYLGDIQERKGYRLLINALRDTPDIFLLMGGQYTKNFQCPELHGRYHGAGLVDALTFYTACDVLIVPSLFDPSPMVVFEASAHGTPVIVTDGVGNGPTLLEFNAGEKWSPDQPLPPLVRKMAANPHHYHPGIQQMAKALSKQQYAQNLLIHYDEVLAHTQPASLAFT